MVFSIPPSVLGVLITPGPLTSAGLPWRRCRPAAERPGSN